MAIESDNTEHKAAISEAEQILKDAKTSFRDSLISQEMHPEPHKPDRVQKSAVNEAEKIINNGEINYIISVSKDGNRKLFDALYELKELKKDAQKKHQDKDEWQETVVEKVIPREATGNYVRKYQVKIGHDQSGDFYRIEHVRIQDDKTEHIIEASQLKEPTNSKGLGLYIPSMIHEVYDPKDLTVVQKTTFDEPDLATRSFTKMYDKAKPGKAERVGKWFKQRLNFKKKT